MVKINFAKIKAKDLHGREIIYDAAESLADFIYNNTPSIKGLKLAENIYEKKSVELTDQEKEIIKQIAKNDKTPFKAIVKVELLKLLKTE